MIQRALSTTVSSSDCVSMIPVDVLLFSLVFPTVASITGAYLIFRGMGRLSRSGTPVVCGKVKCKDPIKSLAIGSDCVFFDTLLEVYKNGRWHPFFSIKYGTPFMVGNRQIEEWSVGYIKLSKPIIMTGTTPHRKDFIENWTGLVRRSFIYRPVSFALSILGRNESSYLPLEGSVLTRLQEHPDVKGLLVHNNVGLIRITEDVIHEGMDICVIAEADKDPQGPLKGTTEFPLIFTDMKPDDATESLKERALLSVGLGILLLGISAIILAFLFTQL